ncbi:MAG: hypothetical protein Q4F23_06390 [Coriobacteriia bacterium]|nr:hypothetical protein [Coriobacteriia bacterium]
MKLGYTSDFDETEHYNTKIYESALESLTKEDSDNKILKELNEHFEEAN